MSRPVLYGEVTTATLARWRSHAVASTARVRSGARLFAASVLVPDEPRLARDVLAALKARGVLGALRRDAGERPRRAPAKTPEERRAAARDRNRRWREKHPETWRAYQRRKVARWRAKHHEQARAIERRSDAKRRGRTT